MTAPATEVQGVHDPKNALVLKYTSGATGRSVVFMKLRDLYPECLFLIEDLMQMFPLRCLRDDGCPRNMSCMGTLVKRLQYVFETFDDADLVLLYFSYRDMPGSQRAGVFWRDMREPRYTVFNRTAWEKMKSKGQVFEWRLPDNLFLVTTGMSARP
jgi:hypothetical protein